MFLKGYLSIKKWNYLGKIRQFRFFVASIDFKAFRQDF